MAFLWPVTLPQSPLLDGYSEDIKDTTARSKMDYGPDKSRNLVTGTIINATLRLLLTPAQTVLLDTFYLGELGRVGTFDWIHPRTGNSALCRFTAPPSYIPASGLYYAKIQIEFLPASFSAGFSGGFA